MRRRTEMRIFGGVHALQLVRRFERYAAAFLSLPAHFRIVFNLGSG